jgi:hypothetical protein
MESIIQRKIKIKQEWYLQWWSADYGSNKKLLQKVPIDRVAQNSRILQVLQFIGVVRRYLRNLEGTSPQGFKFSMFAFVLFGGIPLKHQIPQLKIFLACALVEGLLYFLLMIRALSSSCSLVYYTSTNCSILLTISSGSPWNSWKNFSTGKER